MLQLIDTEKTYPHPSGDIRVLTGVNAAVKGGETVAILGPSGSGKSTLLSLLAGLDRPTKGRIEIDQQDLATLSEKALTSFRARHVGIIFQHFHLMAHLTALENVALPCRIGGKSSHASAELARTALAGVGLAQRTAHFTHELSGGERQRVAIARALVGKPPLILADEPSGNLDTKTGEQVMHLLFDLVRTAKLTLVLVTHNEELARWCDRRLVLTSGRLIED